MVFESSTSELAFHPSRPFDLLEHTDWNHTLGVIIQILQQHLTQGEDLTPTPHPPRPILAVVFPNSHAILLPTDKAALLFQTSQQPPDLCYHLPVHNPIRQPLLHDNRPVEDELISRVSAFADADGISDDAVVVDAKGEEAVAELLGRDEVRSSGVEGEERGAQSGGRGGRRYAALGDLVEDAGAYATVSWGTRTRKDYCREVAG